VPMLTEPVMMGQSRSGVGDGQSRQ
jgi:hypothetical protein